MGEDVVAEEKGESGEGDDGEVKDEAEDGDGEGKEATEEGGVEEVGEVCAGAVDFEEGHFAGRGFLLNDKVADCYCAPSFPLSTTSFPSAA